MITPQAVAEPRDLDWGEGASTAALPDIVPTIPALMELARGAYASRELMVHDDRRVTYAEVEEHSARIAWRLIEAGIGKGAHVGVLLPDDERFIATWTAVNRIGAVAVAMSTLATSAEMARLARHGDLELIVAAPGYLNHDYRQKIAEAFPDVAGQAGPLRLTDAPFLRGVWFWPGDLAVPDWAERIDPEALPPANRDMLSAIESEVRACDPAGIVYTSGSTAEPKGVIHSHGNFVRQGMKMAMSFEYRSDERVFSTLPFFWVGGIATTLMCAMTIGAAIIGSSRKGTHLVDMLERERVTAVVSWPHILRAIAEDPTFSERDWSAMRNGLLHEALPADRQPSDPALMPTPLGMTETTGPYTRAVRELPERHRGAIGPLLPGIEGRLVDPDSGQIIGQWTGGGAGADSGGQTGVMEVRGDVLMLGMVKRERERVFTPDGWYHTGDLCSFSEGYMYFHGRADDLIKASGANVSPAEVELAIREMDGVASAVVLGVQDKERGSVVGAVVVPKPGARIDSEAVRAHAAKVLSSYKRPRAVIVIESSQMPLLASRKIDRLALVRLLEEQLALQQA